MVFFAIINSKAHFIDEMGDYHLAHNMKASYILAVMGDFGKFDHRHGTVLVWAIFAV